MVDQIHSGETSLFGTVAGCAESPLAGPTVLPAGPHSTFSPVRLPDIPGYQLLSILGRGGMGQVFLAVHLELERQVALKVVAAGATATPETLQRFRAESRAVAAIKHPGVCQIFEAGQAGHIPFLAMEYVDGLTLSQSIREQLPVPRQAAAYILSIAQALQTCHETGILHRDLKPSNVMLNREGTIKVMDFGLAKRLGEDEQRTRTGEIIGTPSYMAPEQASGVVKQLGPECDVYAIGAIFYELLTGRPPFQTPDVMQTMMLVLTTDPVRPRALQPRIPVDLETICLKCLEKSPRRRYSSAQALAEDVQRFLDHKPILARRTPVWERVVKWVRRHPAMTALIVMGSLAGTGAVAGALFHVNRLQVELSRSERLLNGGLDHGRWLVQEHIPGVARLRGGGPHQSALVDKTLEHLRQLSLDAGDDRKLGAYIAQTSMRIAEIQSDFAFATPERIRQSLTSYERALEAYRHLLQNNDPLVLKEQVRILLRMSALNTQLKHPQVALQQATHAIEILSTLEKSEHSVGGIAVLSLSAQIQQAELQLQLAELQQPAREPSERTQAQADEVFRQLFLQCQNLDEANLSDGGRELLARLSLKIASLIKNSDDRQSSPADSTVDDYYTTAIEELSRIPREDPRIRRELALALIRQGEHSLRHRFQLCDQLKVLPAMLELAEEHRQIAEDLYLSDPDEFRNVLQGSLLLQTLAHRRRSDYDGALRNLSRAVELAQNHPSSRHNPSQQRELAQLLRQKAELLIERDHQSSIHLDAGNSLAQAIFLLDQSLKIHQELAESIPPPSETPYWETIELKHQLEKKLEQWKINNREKIGISPVIEGPEGPFQGKPEE